MSAPAALPRLDTRRAVERAHQSRLVLSYELALQAHLARTLASIGQAAAKAFRAGEKIEAMPIRQQLARVLRPALVGTARAFADRLTHTPKSSSPNLFTGVSKKVPLERKGAFDNTDAAIRDYMTEHTAEAVVGITETTRNIIANAIMRGHEDGQSNEQIAKAIVEATGGEIGLARARMIAITETHGAAMYGAFAAAQASPLAYRKTWLATEDHRTRPDHAEANGQTVALDEPFIVGGVEMAYPGDFSAPPEQIIRCRCVALFEPVGIGEDQ